MGVIPNNFSITSLPHGTIGSETRLNDGRMIGNPQTDELLHILRLNHIHTVPYIFNNSSNNAIGNNINNNRHNTPNNFIRDDRIHEDNTNGGNDMETIQQDANEIHIKSSSDDDDDDSDSDSDVNEIHIDDDSD